MYATLHTVHHDLQHDDLMSQIMTTFDAIYHIMDKAKRTVLPSIIQTKIVIDETKQLS